MSRPSGSKNKPRVTVICKNCQNPFNVTSSESYRRTCPSCIKFRSRLPYGSRIVITCRVCENPFGVQPSYSKITKTCPDCRTKFPPRTRVSIFCKKCEIPFDVRPSDVLSTATCTDCRQKKHERVRVICRQCRDPFDVLLSEMPREFCNRRCHRLYRGPSSIEILMSDALLKNHIPVSSEFKIGRYLLDFAIIKPKIAIECDGEYWHSSPEDIESDLQRDRYLKSLGWTVLRFTGMRIENDIESCIQEILLEYCRLSTSSES